MKQQFPQVNGLMSCLSACKFMRPSRVGGEFVQIVNTQPVGNPKKPSLKAGSHWVTLTSIGCNNTDDNVQSIIVYDSLGGITQGVWVKKQLPCF